MAQPNPMREWDELVAFVNNRTLIGTAGHRDSGADNCTAFAPGAPDTFGNCESDGHYMCAKCSNLSLREQRRRNNVCEDCGGPLGRSELCVECDGDKTILIDECSEAKEPTKP